MKLKSISIQNFNDFRPNFKNKYFF